MYHDLVNKRSQKIVQWRSIVDKANKENRDLNPEEKAQVDELKAAVDSLTSRVEALEQLEQAEESAGVTEGDRSRQPRGLEGREMPEMDGKHKYSLMKVIRSIADKKPLTGLEAEVHQEISRVSERKAQGYFVPSHLATHRSDPRRERRDITTSSGAGSIAAILSTDFIEILRNRMLTMKLGAQMLDGMTGGSFSIPKQTATTTAYWITEGNAPTGTQQTIGQVTFTPKTIGAFTDLSRKFILQTSLAAEAFVKSDLALTLAVELDRAGINGSGSGAEPRGLCQSSNVTTIALGTNGAAPSRAKLTAMEQAVSVANADLGEMAFLGNNYVRNTLKNTLVSDGSTPNTAAKYLWDDQTNEVVGYKAYATNQIPNNFTKGSGSGLSALLFGYWPSLIYGAWGAVDLLEDPYTKSNSGGVRIVMLQDVDIQARYEAAFAKIVDMITL